MLFVLYYVIDFLRVPAIIRDGYTLTYWCELAMWGLMGVVVFIGKKNISMVVLSGVFALWQVYFLMKHFSMQNLSRTDVLHVLAAVSLFIIVLLNCIPALSSMAKITRFIWFIPALCMVILTVLLLRGNLAYLITDKHYYLLLPFIFEILAFLFLGLWLQSGDKGDAKKEIAG